MCCDAQERNGRAEALYLKPQANTAIANPRTKKANIFHLREFFDGNRILLGMGFECEQTLLL